jgi:transposase
MAAKRGSAAEICFRTLTDPTLFWSGREFAAWLGMTARQNSSGGKERLGRTSKRGDKYIRCLLVAGAVAILRHTRNRATKDAAWHPLNSNASQRFAGLFFDLIF